jgi:hypothetical protein
MFLNKNDVEKIVREEVREAINQVLTGVRIELRQISAELIEHINETSEYLDDLIRDSSMGNVQIELAGIKEAFANCSRGVDRINDTITEHFVKPDDLGEINKDNMLDEVIPKIKIVEE